MNGTSPRIRVKVTCHTCHERLTAVAKPYARKLKCPECEAPIHVPAYDPIEAEFQRKLAEPRNVDPGVYGIAQQSEEDVIQIKNPFRQETITLKCPQCLSLLSPELKDEAWTDTCPDCLEEYRVPGRSENPEKPKPIPIPDPGQYTAGVASKPVPMNTKVYDHISEIKQVEIDPPPKWVYFSKVFEYPWTKYVLSRWLWTSLAWSASWVLVALVVQFLFVGGAGTVAAGFFALPTFWVSFWTLSYTSACGMAILEGTGAGQVVIDEWPEPDWREWATNMFYVAFIGLVAQGISVVLEMVSPNLPAPWLISLAQVHVIYPVILLSALETGTMFWPFSVPVYQSMWSHGRYWFLYYLLAGSLSAGYVSVAGLSVLFDPIFSALWMGPLTASVIFIHARLLGRLGWRVLIEPDGGKKRLKKMEKLKRLKEQVFESVDPPAPETPAS
ncbi:MAG: hypothetical protein HUJ26_10805 [Planctomycetaceae bacterium]|nr:hypothetical protein [Planctomycetaceae bacterium]